MSVPKTNMHIHTPYSFSAFNDVQQIIEKATNEDLSVVGITDFNTTAGFEEFMQVAETSSFYPTTNIETIFLEPSLQKQNIRLNDPKNPGIGYFCGKSLACDSKGKAVYESSWVPNTLQRLTDQNAARMKDMLQLLNGYLKQFRPILQLDYDWIHDTLTRGMVRERHIAQAVSIMVKKQFTNPSEQLTYLEQIFKQTPKSSMDQEPQLQNEIRSHLLKAGAPAFIAETDDAYLSVAESMRLIKESGGIPCYPILADGTKAACNEWEKDPHVLINTLLEMGVIAVEFIPNRNAPAVLQQYVDAFNQAGMIVICGTEHNTKNMIPLIPQCKEDHPLPESTQPVFWEGACICVAHQAAVNQGDRGLHSIMDQMIADERVRKSVCHDFQQQGSVFIQERMD